jgi:hypothetical protein
MCETKLLLLLAFFIGNEHTAFLPIGRLTSTKSYRFQHIILLISIQDANNELLYNRTFFCSAVGNKKCQGGQGFVTDNCFVLALKQSLVLLQKIEKTSGSYAFISIHKRMVFGNVVQQIGCFFFYAWV